MITFAGVSLLLEDPEGRAAAFVRRYLEWPTSLLNSPARTIDSKSRVQRPQWMEQPRLRPNQLYWPTGATRWAQFIGLATEDAKNAILATAARGIGTLSIQLDNSPTIFVAGNTFDGDPFYLNSTSALLTTDMYLLPPQPVSQTPESLWIIPLVDERYWWQTAMFVSTSTQWSGLLGEIQSALGDTLTRDTTDVIDRNYGTPDKCVFRNGAINAAAALDMLCWATNQRLVVRNIGEGVQRYVLRSMATASKLYKSERDAQLASVASSAGGDWGVNEPWVSGATYALDAIVTKSGNLYLCIQPGTSSSTGPTGTGTSTDGTCQWIYVGPAPVNGDVPTQIQFHFTNDGSTEKLAYAAGTVVSWADGKKLDLMCQATSTGSNDDTLRALADKWANDFWQWSRWRFAWSFNYLLDWHFTGYEDYMLIDLARNPRGYIARTFIRSMQATGWGMDFVPIQVFGGGNSCGGTGGFPLVHFTITDKHPDCAGGMAEATIDNVPCDCDDPVIGDIIDVHDLYGQFAGENEDTLLSRGGWAIKMTKPDDTYESCAWVIMSLDPIPLSC